MRLEWREDLVKAPWSEGPRQRVGISMEAGAGSLSQIPVHMSLGPSLGLHVSRK